MLRRPISSSDCPGVWFAQPGCVTPTHALSKPLPYGPPGPYTLRSVLPKVGFGMVAPPDMIVVLLSSDVVRMEPHSAVDSFAVSSGLAQLTCTNAPFAIA